ncbi:MAG: cytochrome b N-terminal domain-containing protein [Planctomycetia bacterium]|nr:cytochrome b N-terminal domain-containing protein [Planctomycetia bacterium]
MFLLDWIDERTGLITGLRKVLGHKVPANFCFCRFLPVAIVFAFLLQGLTGLFLWAFYAPSAQTAWESVYYIQYEVPFGWLVRGIHHYSAQLLVAMLGLYVLMLILHGGYRKPREFVYWSAIVLFLLSLCSCLTGDLLMWSLSGYFATIARVSFLQLLPGIGVPLYQLAAGGPDPAFGTFTLTRFLVLHVAVFGGGFLLVLLFWKWSDLRSRVLARGEQGHNCALACANRKQRSFWGWEVLLCSVICIVTLCAVLLLVFQHSLTHEQIAARSATLPAEAYLGAELTSPADPGGSYDAARPEWSFRALYFMSKLPIFSKIGMIFAIFVIPGCLGAYFFALPLLGYFKPLHYVIVAATAVLFGVFCWFTYASYWDDYRNPEHAPTFLASQAQANVLKGRVVELIKGQDGIPGEGALSLLKKDPFVQGPALFAQHCSSCHNFEPTERCPKQDDFAPIITAEPSAPNLYGAGSAAWIAGFHDADLIRSNDYFGKTTDFAKKGSMIGFATGRVYGGADTDDGSFILNPSGLIYPLIGYDGGVAFDVLEASLNELAADASDQVESGQYVAALKEKVAAKFADAEFMASTGYTLPKQVAAATCKVLLEVLDDPAYQELLTDEDNIALILDDDVATFLSETFLLQLCGNEEPIAKEDCKYINELRAGIMAACNEVANDLHAESLLDAPRALVDGKYEGLREGATSDMNYLTCTECHAFYGAEEKDLACDLRGYMSRQWLAGIISDPTAKEYYGHKNDRMPAYHPAEGDKLMSEQEVEMLTDWMRGNWYRAKPVENQSRLGNQSGLVPDLTMFR